MILPDPVGETVVPASEQVAASEPSASAPAPKQTYTKTPEKATKSVPQQIELVNQPEPIAETVVPESVHVTDFEQTITVTESEPNQRQPEQPHQPSPNQTTISTPTSNQPENQHSPQKAIPVPVVETVVSTFQHGNIEDCKSFFSKSLISTLEPVLNPASDDNTIMDISDLDDKDIKEITVSTNLDLPAPPTSKPITVSPPPTIILQQTILKEVCNNIFEDLMELVNSRNLAIHLENYEDKRNNLRAVVNGVFNDLQRLSSLCGSLKDNS